jgi:hypothetical protein
MRPSTFRGSTARRRATSLNLIPAHVLVATGALFGTGCAPTSFGCDAYNACIQPDGGQSGSGAGGQAGSAGAGSGGVSAGTGGGSSGAAGDGGESGDGGGDSGGSGGGEGGSGGTEPCDGACQGATPVCKASTNECVECTEEQTDACTGLTPLCDTETNSCVECLMQSNCAEPTASRCDGGACLPCSDNAHCTNISGRGVCSSGVCVQCTAADEAACGANSCNPMTKQCTSTPRGTVGTCRPCVADSECTGGNQADPDARCVQMEFMGSLRPGGFCLRRAAKTCARPYMIAISAPSLSGALAENYCGIDQENVRCEAVLDLINSRSCPGGADISCGCARDQDGFCTEGGQGGLCRDFTLVNDQCTYQCGINNDCPVGRTCLGSPIAYCQ